MRLDVLIGNRSMGSFRSAADGRVSFTYDEAWRNDPATYPLSLSMPKTAARYGGGVVTSWLWNLLPESGPVLQRIADDTGNGAARVSARNPLALLAKIGEDCPGAIQLVQPERLDRLPAGKIIWLDEAEIARRLKDLRENRGVLGREHDDPGRFSLAGVETKTAFHYAAGRWGIPSGRIPTTHIFKPPVPGMDGQVEIEHFCLRLARAAGVPSVRTEVIAFGDEKAIVVERYDRLRTQDGSVLRIHQEDMSQALRIPPARKYQTDGGPGLYDIMTKVLANSADPEADRAAFVRIVALNFIIGGTDAHAKNYSILFGRGGAYRLAPIYDVNSILPYVKRPGSSKLSMSVDGRAVLREIQPRHWKTQAKACSLPADTWLSAVCDLIDRVPDLARDTLEACRAEGLVSPILDGLCDRIAARCLRLSTLYKA